MITFIIEQFKRDSPKRICTQGGALVRRVRTPTHLFISRCSSHIHRHSSRTGSRSHSFQQMMLDLRCCFRKCRQRIRSQLPLLSIGVCFHSEMESASMGVLGAFKYRALLHSGHSNNSGGKSTYHSHNLRNLRSTQKLQYHFLIHQ